MPAPHAPKLTGHPSPQELRRVSRQIRASQGITAQAPIVMGQGASGFHIGVDKSRDWFLARLVSSYTLTSTDVEAGAAYAGMTAGTILYAFIEQSFNVDAGIPIDNPAGRSTFFDDSGTIVSAYQFAAASETPAGTMVAAFALEDNNSSVSIQTSAQSPFVNPGPYVEMRLKGIVNGVPVYEFSSAPDLMGFVLTANPATLQTVSMPSGTIQAVAARVMLWDSATGGFLSGATCWFYEPNAQGALPNFIYASKLVGRDNSSVPIYSTHIEFPLVLNSVLGSDLVHGSISGALTVLTLSLTQGTWIIQAHVSAAITGSPGNYLAASLVTLNSAVVASVQVASVTCYGTAHLGTFLNVGPAGGTVTLQASTPSLSSMAISAGTGTYPGDTAIYATRVR